MTGNCQIRSELVQLIQAAIHCRGKASQMASSLKIDRTSFWRKLKQFNIHLADYKVG
ncbi:helix-turn-helix domain-containing protein [Symbiopectobacterium purcellii]|uniref:helix-turn-helix domain-containing protein n=1 Tax=Symbiopectobacterium purcellii TaxID=2871826 RepID=UPI003F86C321